MRVESSFLKEEKGFTLIELLVVIAIIGVLSSVVMVSLNAGRARARDAKRQGDLNAMRTALELFHDSTGRYPSTPDGDCNYNKSFLLGGCLQILVSGGFISLLPSDPTSSGQYYYDNWCRETSGYILSNQSFRMWANGEFNHNGLAQNWWSDYNIGYTTCLDPS